MAASGGGHGGWTPERIDQVVQKWMEERVPLTEPVPIYVLYWTAWADPDGTVHFRPDVYGYDERLANALAWK